MASILYGVNGEGSGHSTRAKEVIAHLQERGHQVHVVSFDRGLKNLSGVCEVTEIYGLRFAYVNNRVAYKRTLVKNLITAPQAIRSMVRLSRLIDAWKIELVITDFEPLSCRVGHRKRLPVISIDNQHCLTNTVVSYPKRFRRDAAAAKLVTRLMTPKADAYLVTSFFPTRVRRTSTFVFPPILRAEILHVRPKQGQHTLVYVTSPAPALAKVLRKVSGRFVAYGFGKSGKQGNIHFKAPSATEFRADLASCKAVIANAGFSLVSEALYLGKPYLAVPVQHQFEQMFNAYYLSKMGYGEYGDDLSVEKVESFLKHLPLYHKRLAHYPRKGNSALLGKLDQLIASHTKARSRVGTKRP